MANILTDVSVNDLQGCVYGVVDQYLAVVTGAGGAPPEGEVGPAPGDIYPIRVSGITGDDADANGIYAWTIDGWVKGNYPSDGWIMKGGGPLEGEDEHEWYIRRWNPPTGHTIAWTDTTTGFIPPCLTWEGGTGAVVEKYGPYYDQTYTPVGVSNMDVYRWLSADEVYEIVWYADTSDGLFHWAIVAKDGDPQTAYIHRGGNAIDPQYSVWEGTVQVSSNLGGTARVTGSDTAGCNQDYVVNGTSPGFSTVYLSEDGLYYLVYYRQEYHDVFGGCWLLMWVAYNDPTIGAYATGIDPTLRYSPDKKWSSDAIYPWLADWNGTWAHVGPLWTSYYPPWVPGETGIAVAKGTAVVSGWKTVGGRTCLKFASNGYANVRGATELNLAGIGALSRVRVAGAGGLPGYSTANQVYAQGTPADYSFWGMNQQANWNGTYYYGASCSDSPVNFWIMGKYYGDATGDPSGALTNLWWGLFHYPTIDPAYHPAYYAPSTTNAWDAVWSPYYGIGDYFNQTATPITVTRELPDDPATGLAGWTILADVWVDAIDAVERGIIIRRSAEEMGLISMQGGDVVYCMALDDDGKVYVSLAGGSYGGLAVTAKQTAQIITGAWQRYIAVWDGANLILYLNGTAVATTACAVSGAEATTSTFIGMMNDCGELPADWGLWKGSIGSVIMVAHAATPTEIACNPLFAKVYGGAAAAPPA
jgi:hypothetical protein